MRALFTNQAWTATFAAAHEDSNYPITNVRDDYLNRIFKSTANADTIAITFAAATSVDCVYIALTNAATITLRLYNAANALLATVSVDASELCETFTAVASVKSAQIDFATGSAALVYVGSIGIGAAYSFPAFDVDYSPAPIDNSVIKESRDGQRLVNKIDLLRAYTLSFSVPFATYVAIRDLVNAMTRPVFIDLFESSRDVEPVLFGVFDGGLKSIARAQNHVAFSLTPREVR